MVEYFTVRYDLNFKHRPIQNKFMLQSDKKSRNVSTILVRCTRHKTESSGTLQISLFTYSVQLHSNRSKHPVNHLTLHIYCKQSTYIYSHEIIYFGRLLISVAFVFPRHKSHRFFQKPNLCTETQGYSLPEV